MFSPLRIKSPRASRATTPNFANDYGYEPPDFNSMLYQVQTDRACIPYSIPSDQVLFAQSEVRALEQMVRNNEEVWRPPN